MSVIEKVKKGKIVQSIGILKNNLIPTIPKFNDLPINEQDILRANPDDLLSPHFESQPSQKWRYPGERIICQCENVSKSDTPIVGTFFLTNYRILFLPTREIRVNRNSQSPDKRKTPQTKRSGLSRDQWAKELVNIPLSCVLYYYGKDITSMNSGDPIGELFFHSKILDYLGLYFYPDSKTRVIPHRRNKGSEVASKLSDGARKLEQYFQSSYSTDQHKVIFAAVHACLQNSKISNLFAYSYRNRYNSIYSAQSIQRGWELFEPVREFKRQKVTKGLWRVSKANLHYQLCSTYPNVLLVPKRISDAQLRESSMFRSSERLPVITWNHPEKNHESFLCRSSQPRTGLSRSRSKEDEDLIDEFRKLSGSEIFYIVDCRPKKNVWAMQFMGKGTEIDGNYRNAKVEYLGIENIHVMRASIFEVFELLQTTRYGNEGRVRFSSGIQDPSHIKNRKMETWDQMDEHFLSSLEECSWFRYCRSVMVGAIRVARYLEYRKSSVLVHCSDGWDRTSQVCSLAQIMLDPYYRTLEGFAVLIEKDWCGYGFKFKDRNGLVSINQFDDKNYSPIFIQFLDCISYLWHEDPSQFEFNIHFLNYLVRQTYGSLFGNFLNNNQREKRLLDTENQTISIWTEAIFKEEKRVRFKNKMWSENVRKKRVIIPRDITIRKFVTTFFNSTNIYQKNLVSNLMVKKITSLEKELSKKNERIGQMEEEIKNLKKLYN